MMKTNYSKPMPAMTVSEKLAIITNWNKLLDSILASITYDDINIYSVIPVGYEVKGEGRIYEGLNNRIANHNLDWNDLIYIATDERDKLKKQIINAKVWGKRKG